MAIHPPWNDTIIVIGQELDENGNPALDRWGNEKPATEPRTTEARVKYSGERIVTPRGDETTAKLELKTPAEFRISEGDLVRWTDHNGAIIETRVATFKEVLDYPGIVQYRKVWTE